MDDMSEIRATQARNVPTLEVRMGVRILLLEAKCALYELQLQRLQKEVEILELHLMNRQKPEVQA